jgi:hypothetical protein
MTEYFMFNPKHHDLSAQNKHDSAIIGRRYVPNIGEAIIFSDEGARDAYGQYVEPGFSDTGIYVEQDGVDYDRDPITGELVSRPHMVPRYWGRI